METALSLPDADPGAVLVVTWCVVGTIAMEILKATNGQPLDAVFVCVGGGGLIAGVAACIKAVRPSVKVRRIGMRDPRPGRAGLQAMEGIR